MWGCFLYSVFGSDGKFDIVVSSDCSYQSLLFLSFVEICESTIVESCYFSKWECQKYIWGNLQF